ncbi:MAG: L-carnitine dehydrogenase [Gammaproteobacteria bacterium]|nr:L-carnitine dehydrogenase [Gammaproteobacteria bacterium]
MAAAAAIQTVGIAGCGVIGAGWTARCLAHGLDVIAWDPAADAEAGLREAVDNAWPAVTRLGLSAGASRERLRFAPDLAAMCRAADFIQECAPEREDLKRELHAQMDALADRRTVIASSTSGLLPSNFQAGCRHPQRIVVGHPFNPVYLLPLVEVLGGRQTAAAHVEEAVNFYRSIGMHPLRVRAEVPGFLSDRLQEALWREALHLVNEGAATTEELDAAITYGPGLRWALWGVCMIFHLAGGAGGMRHTLRHFDPQLFPWSKLPPPPMGEKLIETMADGGAQQTAGRSLRELEQRRDNCLVAILEALAAENAGAGKVLRENRARRQNAAG